MKGNISNDNDTVLKYYWTDTHQAEAAASDRHYWTNR